MVDFLELKKAVQDLNIACNTGIKTIGIKKEVMLQQFEDNYVANIASDEMPDSVKEFYDDNFGISPSVEAADSEPVNAVDEPVSKYGKSINDMIPITAHFGVAIIAGISPDNLENQLIENVDALSGEEWDNLPEQVQQWDLEISEAINAVGAVKVSADSEQLESKEKIKEILSKKKDKATEPPSKKKPKKPKDGKKIATFTEGTSSAHIMDIFRELFEKSNGEGLTKKDISAACIKAQVKSKNIPARVSTVIGFAVSNIEGPDQLVRVGTLYYPKGSEPK